MLQMFELSFPVEHSLILLTQPDREGAFWDRELLLYLGICLSCGAQLLHASLQIVRVSFCPHPPIVQDISDSTWCSMSIYVYRFCITLEGLRPKVFSTFCRFYALRLRHMGRMIAAW